MHAKAILSVVTITFTVATALTAAGKDLDLLSRYLVPIFLAQNFAAVCAAVPNSSIDLAGINAASAALKKEITEGLPDDEAAEIVLLAANTARRAATQEMHALSVDGEKISASTMDTWCRETAGPYLAKVLRTNQLAGDRMKSIINQAKEH